MAKIDEIKEELNYLKDYEISSMIKILSDISVIIIDKRIKAKIKSLKDL